MSHKERLDIGSIPSQQLARWCETTPVPLCYPQAALLTLLSSAETQALCRAARVFDEFAGLMTTPQELQL
jgi:hypothetical protein